MPKRSLRNSWMYIADASADVDAGDMTGNYVEVTVGEGNISWTEARSMVYQRDRGRIIDVDTVSDTDLVVGTVVDGDEAPMEVSFDIRFEYYIGDSTLNPIEALKGLKPANYDTVVTATRNAEAAIGGEIEDWVTADTVDPCSPWSVNVFVKFMPTCSILNGTVSADSDEWLKFPIFRWDQLQFNLADGRISCSGKCQAVKPLCRKPGDTTWT